MYWLFTATPKIVRIVLAAEPTPSERRLRAKHVPYHKTFAMEQFCLACGPLAPWPCDTIQALDELQEMHDDLLAIRPTRGQLLAKLKAADATSNETFRQFQETSKRRCEEGFGHAVAWDEPSWPLQNWALAICGEAGELANLVKKCLRGDYTVEEKREEILDELADVMTYCDLAISSLGADTGETVWRKFAEVSRRIGWDVKHG